MYVIIPTALVCVLMALPSLLHPSIYCNCFLYLLPFFFVAFAVMLFFVALGQTISVSYVLRYGLPFMSLFMTLLCCLIRIKDGHTTKV